jgi:hypothetical protein
MSDVSLNINQKEVVELTNKLEKLHRSALPVAIKSTLNDLAFETRKAALKEFDNKFIVRRPTFPKSHIRANKSPNTFDIDRMISETGVIEGKSISGDRLELQEFGGTIPNRSVPTEKTRTGGIETRQSARYYYRKFKNARLGHNPSQKGKRIRQRPNTTILKTRNALIEIRKGGDWNVLYHENKNVDITKNAFMDPAARKVIKRVSDFYAKQAKRQIERLK